MAELIAARQGLGYLLSDGCGKSTLLSVVAAAPVKTAVLRSLEQAHAIWSRRVSRPKLPPLGRAQDKRDSVLAILGAVGLA